MLPYRLCYSILVCLSLFINACRPKVLEIKLPESPTKLVVFSELANGTPFVVQVSQSVPISGIVPENLQVSQAEIWILKDGKKHCRLIETSEKGRYSNDCIPETGGSYQVQVIATGFPEAVSEAVVLPDILPSFRYEHYPNRAGTINAGHAQDEFRIWVNNSNQPDEHYYLVGVRAVYEDPLVFNQFWAAVSDVPLNETGCSTLGGHSINEVYYQYFLVKGACLSGNNHPLVIYLQFQNQQVVQGLEVIVGRVTEENFFLQKTFNETPEGMDVLFTSPDRYRSNIKGGYGMVTASSSFITRLER